MLPNIQNSIKTPTLFRKNVGKIYFFYKKWQQIAPKYQKYGSVLTKMLSHFKILKKMATLSKWTVPRNVDSKKDNFFHNK
jgi:hypothetical protein